MTENTKKRWTYRAACEVVDVRDMDRSVMSGVPKTSGPAGRYSHHHRQLRSRGGTDSPANLILLTGSGTTGEHGWVHENPGPATVLGYMVPSWADPTSTPIYRLDMFGMDYGWHMQDDDGQVELCDPPTDTHPAEVIEAALAVFDAFKTKSRMAAIRNL